VVWRRLTGALEVITGRHRLDLAKRAGERTIPAQIVNEADGFTRERAATFDAESNIRDNQGSLRDYAGFFRASSISEGDARQRGLLRTVKGNDGYRLGKDASDDLYAVWRNREISDAKAVAIVQAAGVDHALQAVGLRFALDNPRANAEEVGATTKAFQHIQGEGGVQTDMFGNTVYDGAIQEAQSRAKIALERQRAIAEQLRILKLGKIDPAKAREVGINIDVADRAALEQTKARLTLDLDRWKDWPQHPDLVREVMGRESEQGAQEDIPPGTTEEQGTSRDTADNADQGELFSEEPPRRSASGSYFDSGPARPRSGGRGDYAEEQPRQPGGQQAPPPPPKPERTTPENQPRVELPGLVALSRRLLDKFPHIAERMRRPGILGFFRRSDESITLGKNIFIGPELERTKTITTIADYRAEVARRFNLSVDDVVVRRDKKFFVAYQRDHEYASRATSAR